MFGFVQVVFEDDLFEEVVLTEDLMAAARRKAAKAKAEAKAKAAAAKAQARRKAAKARKAAKPLNQGKAAELATALTKRGVKTTVAKAPKAKAAANSQGRKARKRRKVQAPKGLARAAKLRSRMSRKAKAAAQVLAFVPAWARLVRVQTRAVGATGNQKGGPKMGKKPLDAKALEAKQAALHEQLAVIKHVAGLGLPTMLAARVTTPAAAATLTTSLKVAADNPLEMFAKAAETPQKQVAVPAGNRSLSLLAYAYGLKPSADEDTQIPTGFATPQLDQLGAEQSAFLLRVAGADQLGEHTWKFGAFTFDLVANEVNGNPVRQMLLLSPDGQEIYRCAEEQALAWLILGAFSGVAEGFGKSAEKVLKGYIRVMYAKVWEDGGYGYKDPANQVYAATKTPLFQLGWGLAGYTVKALEQDSAEQFALAAAKADTGAHGQGKFLVDLRQRVLGIKVSGTTRLVHVASVATAKWFKRLTLGLALQVPLLNHDTGHFRTAGGGEHHGRFTQVLYLEDGLNFPYLGNGVSMLSRKAMASHFKALTPVGHEVPWAGVHTPELPEPGRKVRKGDVLVEGPVPVVATTSGVVLEASAKPGDGSTTITVVVGNLDRTGQIKARSETLKASFAYPRWTGIDYAGFAEANNIPVPQLAAGDVAILSGLKPGDKVHIVANQDVNKATGKGNAQGLMSLVANTYGVPVAYDPEADAEGCYDEMKQLFLADAAREVVLAYAVLPEIADAIGAADRDDCKVIPHGDVTVVIQTCRAYLATELVKVESLSVRESRTTGHTPAQVALAANALGLTHGANMIIAGGESLVDDLVKVHETAFPVFDKGHFDSLVEQGHSREVAIQLSFRLGGQLLQDAGVGVVDVHNLDEARRDAMLRRSAAPLELPKRTAYVDVVNGKCVVIDPAVLKAFGSGDQENSLKVLFADLCFNASHGNAKLVSQLLRQMSGLLRKLATGAKVNKRAAKGCKTLHAKTSSGNVPQGWVAIGYRSNIARDLCRLFGVTEVDELWGEIVYCFRNPQVFPVPLRVYFPDAPELTLRTYKDLVPGAGNVDMFLRPCPSLEPDRFFLSPSDTAADNGDHDGDGRNLIAVTDAEAWAEALAWKSEAFRKEVLKTYMAEVKDPVIEAYRQDPSKRSWAKVGVIPYDKFTELSRQSIVNQTLDIGMAYDIAHMYLCAIGDFSPTWERALRAVSLFWGQYEEQLAGLDLTYRTLYGLLQNKAEFTDEDGKLDVAAWQKAVYDANAALNHTESDSTTLVAVHYMVKSAAATNRGKGEVVVKGLALAKALTGQLLRDIAKGSYDAKGKLLPSIKAAAETLDTEVADGKTLRQLIADNADTGSIGSKVLVRYLERIYPLVCQTYSHVARAEEASDDEGEE
jgi:hypothetical protein